MSRGGRGLRGAPKRPGPTALAATLAALAALGIVTFTTSLWGEDRSPASRPWEPIAGVVSSDDTTPAGPLAARPSTSSPAPAAGVAGSASGLPSTLPSAGPTQPTRLRMAALGLDVAVRPMKVAPGGIVDPPTRADAFWVRGYGDAGPATTNTMYIAAHSARRSPAAFSPLLDIAGQQGRAETGQVIEVTAATGVQRYRVTESVMYPKASLARAARVWEAVPGRLVLITCFQYNSARPSDHNYVVYADRVS